MVNDSFSLVCLPLDVNYQRTLTPSDDMNGFASGQSFGRWNSFMLVYLATYGADDGHWRREISARGIFK